MTSSSERQKQAIPPAPDELEISVFGAGVGECIVVHMGRGEWAVVDSCIDRATGNPVALDYLDALGVDPASAIKLLVVTHWHDDHTRGAAAILRKAPAAEVVCSLALRTKEFQTLLGASKTSSMEESGVEEFRAVLNELKARPVHRAQELGPTWAIANTCIKRFSAGSIHALSPASATMTLSYHEIGALVPTPGKPKRRAAAHTANQVAIALWVEFGELKVLLGADLEVGASPSTGWNAILNSAARPPGRAQAFKVAHHGSKNGDHPRIWTDLLDPNPIAVLTPFNAGSKPLPSPSDEVRLRGNTTNLYRAGPLHGAKRELPSAVWKMVRMAVSDFRDEEGRIGHVRARGMQGSPPQWTTETFGAAFKAAA